MLQGLIETGISSKGLRFRVSAHPNTLDIGDLPLPACSGTISGNPVARVCSGFEVWPCVITAYHNPVSERAR